MLREYWDISGGHKCRLNAMHDIYKCMYLTGIQGWMRSQTSALYFIITVALTNHSVSPNDCSRIALPGVNDTKSKAAVNHSTGYSP